MVILQLIDVKNPNGNGVIGAFKNYVKYEKKYCNIGVYNLGSIESKKAIDESIPFFSIYDFNSISCLPTPFNNPDLVVFNEVYKKKYLKIYKECLNKHIPYVIVPHGCLVKKAQSHKKLKKVIGNILFFNKFIKRSIAIQYLNEFEKESSIIKKHYSFISGNGIEINSKFNQYKTKNFIYIGRYDVRIKGLDLIVKTVSQCKNWFEKNNVIIELYGRNSANGYTKLRKLINSKNVSNIVRMNDAVYNDQKEEILLNSYAFIQTSRHEGQPMGIMEALSYGVPCIVTYGTNFGSFVNENKCGIGVHFNSVKLFEAIKKMYEDETFRNECSKNAKKSISKYDWELVIKDCISQYKKLL